MPKPTMDDVAERAGVSRALVSLALRGSDKVSEASRAAVHRAAAELGYRPNLLARHLASQRTRTFGLVVNDLHNPFFPGLADGIKRAADARGYRLLVNSAFLADEVEAEAIETFIDFQIDGMILAGPRIDLATIEQAARAVPLVTASRPLQSDIADSVNNDDVLGGTLAVEHLVALGHRHIVHLSGGSGAGADLRQQGYEAAMRRHGLEPRVVRGSFTEAGGAAAAAAIVDDPRPCTAVFAGNDLSAVGALDVIEDRGLRVPGDVSLVGYDNTFVAALGHIRLTTVDQQRQRLGELSVELLVERIEEGRTEARHVVIPPTLVERDTTAPPPT